MSNSNKNSLDLFVEDYGKDKLPKTVSEFKSNDMTSRPKFNKFEQTAWDVTWGKYYKPDGTLK
jgi:hypothetical protein